ncbi:MULTISPECIES: C45 family autoproteolytic acyltransferase/hydolase [Nocardioides]|uniref:C45 family autoproteolytic acyltransferase/hydrolase n=1 Tax=Nocardioides vastitatis TaxID=2568655 RepID=A0ABW0ZG25_9ACTN|nr:C45 family peptidase [Nocardioides sp.]THI96863.1 acyl-CoA--6-aminopenicillanic acid acyl-transferase [Nocardioides sp.]
MRVVQVKGAPYQCGYGHGTQAHDQINEAADVYRRWFHAFAGLDSRAVAEAVLPHLDWLETHRPDALVEMQGIADGAGLPVSAIAALNFRTEIAYRAVGTTALTECTVVGVDASASADGHVYIGQNWDWLTELLELAILLDIDLEGGRRLVTITEPGMLAKLGMNSSGVGLCVNLLGSDVNGIGGSFHTLARDVLQSTSALDGTWAVSSAERAGSGNFLIGGKTGEVVDLEYNPKRYDLLFPRNGVVAHANHFLAPEPGVRDRMDYLPQLSPGTYFRQHRADQLLDEARNRGGVSLADISQVLRDHYGAPESICRHPGVPDSCGGTREILGQTNVSAIFDLTAAVMHLAVGTPCETTYDTIGMPWS